MLALNEAIGKLVLADSQRITQQFIGEAIKIWDDWQVSGIPYCLWIPLAVAKLWQEMRARN